MSAAGQPPFPTDRFPVTFFSNHAASRKVEERCSAEELAGKIVAATASAKRDLPWLKLSRFGEVKTEQGSLRHNGNLISITGVEADYDGERMSFDDAVSIVSAAGLSAMLYTSPSHTADAPRWRLICPTSRELPPHRRAQLVARVNGLFGGIFAGESFALSQAYYFGAINGNPSPRVQTIHGTPIDLRNDLDAGAIGKASRSNGATTGGPKAEPQPESDQLERRHHAYVESLLANVRAATDGQKHSTLFVSARALGGIAATAGICDDAAVGWLLDALPSNVKDWRVAERTARDGMRSGREDPFELENRPNPRTKGQDLPPGAGDRSDAARPDAEEAPEPPPEPKPDMSVLRLGRRAPPPLPLEVFGPQWAEWITVAAEAAHAPLDYVGLPLIATVSALIGNARWAQATPGWTEPPHLWVGTVGDSGTSKSPGADCILRDVLPVIERKMLGDFPERMREWRTAAEAHKAAVERWEAAVRAAPKLGEPPPMPPEGEPPREPQAPRLRQSDVTVERVATLLAYAAPKGLLIVRDELAGWLLGLNAYNDAGRAFWIEAYGGRPYRVERMKSPEPIVVPRLVVAVTGGTQPEKLAQMFRDADDGLLGRFIWGWPDPLPEFRLGSAVPAIEWAIEALDRLRLLPLTPGPQLGDTPCPVMVPLSPEAVRMMEAFGQGMQDLQRDAGGLMRSAYGKARGLALRLSLVLEMLRWCGTEEMTPPPNEISEAALGSACDFVADYFMPMAERVYGDAAATTAERNAATLARWIVRERATEVHVRRLQREVRLPGLNTADLIQGAAAVLVEAGWMTEPKIGFGPASRVAYRVNPAVFDAAP